MYPLQNSIIYVLFISIDALVRVRLQLFAATISRTTRLYANRPRFPVIDRAFREDKLQVKTPCHRTSKPYFIIYFLIVLYHLYRV